MQNLRYESSLIQPAFTRPEMFAAATFQAECFYFTKQHIIYFRWHELVSRGDGGAHAAPAERQASKTSFPLGEVRNVFLLQSEK